MVRRKAVRERGKIRFSEYFKKLKEGDKVAIKREKSLAANLPKRMQGRTGVIVGKRGRSYVVVIKDFNKPKTFIALPIHLKKITEIVGVKK